jgi:tetratricopeptide (TPR) repeat protein
MAAQSVQDVERQTTAARRDVDFRIRTLPEALILAVLLFAFACAARTARIPSTAEAGVLAAAGCYRCLLEVQALYEKELSARPTPALAAAAFRTAVLLSLREKELGLAARPQAERARALAPRVTATEEAPLVLAIADAINWDYAAMSKEVSEQFIKTRQAASHQVQDWRARLRPRLADPFVAYLEIALACSYGDYRARDAAADAILAQHPSSLLVKYRVGACRTRDNALLEEVIAAEPRFVEAHFFIGRNALALAAGGRGRRSVVVPHLTSAYEAFPRSPSVTMAMAGLHRVLNKLQEAVDFYDQTLAIVPMHREAILGRAIALTHLERRQEAIAAATELLDAGDWYIGDAYYWRAYNYHALSDLNAARDDVERAKERSGLRAEVLLLAGTIYYDRREMDPAVRDLERARELDETLCAAPWYLGLIRSDRKEWPHASGAFEQAAVCYRAAITVLEAELGTQKQLLGASEEGRTVAAEYERLIDRQRLEEARSAFNVAYTSGQAGRRDTALEFARRAATHDAMKARALELIAVLEKGKP